MKISFSVCKQAQAPPLVAFPGGISMEPFTPRKRKDKVVIVMGATGTGKSRLSIDLATRFSAEIVNSDKMQVYKGLNIVTNKVSEEECYGVPHHLLGFVDPTNDFTSTDFRHHALSAVDSILQRDRLPVIAGGSNSYIKALINDSVEFQSKYECCFLWVDVSLPVLHSFVSERVDRMVKSGLVDELRKFFDPEADNERGLRRAIGVPEMDPFLIAELLGSDEKTKMELLEMGINEIKVNTCKLACYQLQNIIRLQNQLGWNMHHLDATEAFLKRSSGGANEAWENLVVRPSTMIVDQFLYEDEFTPTVGSVAAPVLGTLGSATTTTSIATATH